MRNLIKTNNMPYTPSIHLLRYLWNKDRNLSLRWSDQEQKWCLETKVQCVKYISNLGHYKKRKDGVVVENDSWLRAKYGWMLIGCYDPQPLLGDWTIQSLQKNDWERLGGWKQIDNMVSEAEERRLKMSRQADSIYNESIAKDFYESEVWRQGERIAVPSNYTQSDILLKGE